MLDVVDTREAAVATPLVGATDYWFDHTAADAAVAFFPTNLRFTKDRWAGKPFVLEPWEADAIIRPVFGWKKSNGTRRYRRVIVFVPRKNGKTELAAGVALLMLVGDGTYGPEVYAIAKDEDQAMIVVDKARAMTAMSPTLSKHVAVFRKALFCAELQGAFKPLTGNAEGKHGLNMSGMVGDEAHEWPDGRLYTTVHQSAAAREQPLEFLISTAGVRGRGYGWELWEEAQKILDGTVDDPETLVVIYAADADDDWTAEATWAKANPNLGVSVSIDYLRSECRKAQNNPRLENDFRRYHLNQWVNQAVRWLPIDAWDRCRRRDWRDETSLRGRKCFAGGDLSTTRDITTYVLVFPPETEGGVVDVLWRFFVPRDQIADRVRINRLPYDHWVRDGAMMATEGNVTDYEFILARLMQDVKDFDIELFGIDPWNSSHFASRAADIGFPADRIKAVRQGFASLSEPSKLLERLVFAALFDHGGHPVARWMAGNVAIVTDPAGNIKPAKDKSAEKIDGVAAALDALFVWLNGEPAEEASAYETQGLRSITL